MEMDKPQPAPRTFASSQGKTDTPKPAPRPSTSSQGKVDTPQPVPHRALSPRVVLPMDGVPIPAPTQPITGEPSATDFQRCRLCARYHALRVCPVFRAMHPQQRFLIARAQQFCTNCLALSHATSACTSNGNCRTCGQYLHTLLHRNDSSTSGRRLQPPARYPPRLARNIGSAFTGRRQHKAVPQNKHPIKRTTPRIRNITPKGRVTKRLVHEAMRTLKELKDALAA
ncbi:uncharacterized protein LOC118754689 [Rhagoletis pomonella]|uniref:uncharacterized protein LOC118754689 n=1 Tax=Rhagoletis pomonella TaxID=28610 RepID=UPI00178400EA|nr:uncharacterized protein LOC118754689 [Rhagoletis pomonella]